MHINLVKKESQLTNSDAYDVETFHTNRAVSYWVSLYRSSKTASNYNRHLAPEKNRAAKKDTIAFDGTDSIYKMLDWVVALKGKPTKVRSKIVQYEVQIIAHIGSAFVTYVVLNSIVM